VIPGIAPVSHLDERGAQEAPLARIHPILVIPAQAGTQ
jgi:hypothetical protein